MARNRSRTLWNNFKTCIEVMDEILSNKFKSKGLCPICIMEIDLGPKYTCTSEHTICFRCKPYYYSCPICQSPFDMNRPAAHGPSFSSMSPDFGYHTISPRFYKQHPSAPPINEFIDSHRNWQSSSPGNQELKPCTYASFGCWVKLPIYLTDMHESRCQFRPHLEEENLPTDMAHKHENLVECVYKSVGCNVVTSPWRIVIHQKQCIYKDSHGDRDDYARRATNKDPSESELVECKYRKFGCMVNMPRRRKLMHQEQCNYRKYEESDDNSSTESEHDPEEQLPCKWAQFGCRVRPKHGRLRTHETNCNYRMEECTYKSNGCTELFQPSRKYPHEKNCKFAPF